MATDRPARDRAARVAYEAAMVGAPHPTSWECLPAHMHEQWRRVAHRLLGREAYEYVCAAEALSTAARVVASGDADSGQYLELQRAILRFETTIWPEFGDDGGIAFPRAVCRGIPNGPGDGYMSVPGEDYGVSHCEGCAAERGGDDA